MPKSPGNETRHQGSVPPECQPEGDATPVGALPIWHETVMVGKWKVQAEWMAAVGEPG